VDAQTLLAKIETADSGDLLYRRVPFWQAMFSARQKLFSQAVIMDVHNHPCGLLGRTLKPLKNFVFVKPAPLSAARSGGTLQLCEQLYFMG
jgi:hypothetical protein